MSAPVAPRTLEVFMALAYAMEREAVERYTEFADAMQAHNNPEVAALFRTMAQYEAKHAEKIIAEMGWKNAPEPPAESFGWPGYEAPETVPIDEVHYLMQPWHALQLALAAELRAQAFFGTLAQGTTSESVRRAALELQDEEREHAALLRAWLAKVPQPDIDWATDPDPPRYMD